MSKLFKLKEWLTLDEAAAHISSLLGEPATMADLYRFALDGHLIISVDFVNYAKARKGKMIKTEQVEFYSVKQDIFTGEKLEVPYSLPLNAEVRVSEEDWISLDKNVVTIYGVWDLTMHGAERLDIEFNYQQLTSGLEVTLEAIDGAFIQQGDVICQLQTDFDDNEFQEGSNAHQKEMECYITSHEVCEDKAKKIRAKFKVDRDKFLEKRKDKPKEESYFPSGGLDEHDHVLVIRTQELTRFIQSLEDAPASDKQLTSKERNTLLVLIGALSKEAKIDYNQRGMTTVIEKLTENIGSPISDDTIRSVLKQIDDAVESRSK